MKIVIVGGVAGGASAAARARRFSEEAEIVVIERGPDVSFANCGLPYYIGGEIAERDRLLVATPERLRTRYRLDVRTRSSVEAIDRGARAVRVRDLATGREYDEPYDRLILAPGASPIRPPLPGVDLAGIFTLRDLRDADRIKDAVDRGARRAVVVGAGFIGLEMVENLARKGVATTLVEMQDQVLPPLDPEMAAAVAERLKEHGIALRLGQSAAAFEPAGDGLAVRLVSGERLPADIVVLGVGVRPESGLAIAAGLEVGPRGGIRVDEHMRTSDPDIYAVGDAVEVRDFVLGGPAQVPLAGPANRQGRIAADNALGYRARYRGTQGTAIVGVFGLAAALTARLGEDPPKARPALSRGLRPPDPARQLLPRRRAMTLKLLFDPDTGHILGAQAIGEEGVDKRIDVLAMAIQAGMTVFDLEEAELAYAPQFGSAKDAINMAAFVAAGLIRGDHPQVTADGLARGEAGPDPVLLDVRTREEFALDHIPNALNVPVDELRDRLGGLPPGRTIVAYCQVGQRGYLATRILRQAGLPAVNLAGGFASYRLSALAGTIALRDPG